MYNKISIKKLFLVCFSLFSLIMAGYLGYKVGISANNQTTQVVTQTPAVIKQDFIDPLVKEVITGDDYDMTTRSYHRLVLRNTEYVPCLTLEKVTVSQDAGPKVLLSSDLCTLKISGEVKLLKGDSDTDVEYTNLTYKDKFIFNLSLNGMPQMSCKVENTETLETSCSNDK